MKNSPQATLGDWWIQSYSKNYTRWFEENFKTNEKILDHWLPRETLTNTARNTEELESVDAAENEASKAFAYQKIRTSDFYHAVQITEKKSIDNAKLYPQYFDPDTKSGEVVQLLKTSFEYLDQALDYYLEPNFLAVDTSLSNIAVNIKSCHEKIDFNKSLRAVVAFIRRALLQTGTSEISLDSLNQLRYVLTELSENPMLSLVEATKLTKSLKNSGWNGDDELADNLLKALLIQISEESHSSPLQDEKS